MLLAWSCENMFSYRSGGNAELLPTGIMNTPAPHNYHSHLLQVNLDRFDAALCAGSCAVYRRAAVEPFGGVAAIAHSEDMFTGFEMTRRGRFKVWCRDLLPRRKISCHEAMGTISTYLSVSLRFGRLTHVPKYVWAWCPM